MSINKRALALATLFVSASFAQEASDMKDLQAVYVRDSGIASEKIALAERMERLKEWDKSADVYQEIVDKYADRVIPTRSDETGQIAQYTSVALVVQEKLAKWPEDGLNVYRGRYEQTARDMLDRAGDDRLALQRVFSQYFATESAKLAGLRLLAMSLERGEFASAGWVGRRLLSHHPLLVVERPSVLFQTAIAEHLAGNKSGSRAHLEELKQKHPQATGQVHGQDVVLAEVLEQELDTQPSMFKTFQSDAWPMPFGNPEASALPQQTSNGGARLFSIEIPQIEPRRANSMNRRLPSQTADQRKLGGMTGIMPVVDSGEMFFQDNARVYAINLSSGLPLQGWMQSYPGNKKGMFSVTATPTPAGIPLGLCVTEQYVLSVLGQSAAVNVNFNPRNSGMASQLVCLDRTTGRPAWTTTTDKLKLPDQQEQLAQGQFCGMPLVIDDVVYVPVRANRGGQFEEVHIVALRLRDGGYIWSSYLASTAGANAMIDMETGMSVGSFNPMISYADGRLYVLTNLGALGCLDASDGKTIWLNIYPRSSNVVTRRGVRINQFMGGRAPARKPFTQDPPMIVDGRLFVAPSDADSIFVYDAASGESVRRIERDLESPKYEAADMMLGVVGDQLILGNRSTIFSIPWKTFDPKKSILANGGKYRVFEHSGGGGKGEEAIRGRPFVAADRIYIPIATKLHRMSLTKWLIEDSYPQKGAWDSSEEAPGNVLATPDHVIIAGDNRITVYADLAVATAKLDQLIEQDPTAVEPYLRYSELLLAGGRSRDAVDWLDKAIERIGKTDDALTRGTPRDRLFEIACSFATKLAGSEVSTPEVVRQLFDRARLAADAPEQQVRYRLAHAAFLRKQGEAEAEVALHQEILAQPTWRSSSVSGRAGASTAAAEAEAAVAELITKNANLYAPYDRAAKTSFDLLVSDPNAAAGAYLALAEQYPLSASAVPALQHAADRFTAAAEYRLAAQTFRRILKRATDSKTRIEALESLARGYMQMPGQIDLALIRLDQARKLNPQAQLTAPIPLGGDEKIDRMPLTDAVGILKAYRARVESAALPRLNLTDGNEDPEKPALLAPEALAGVQSLVKQQPHASRVDRVVAYKTDGTVVQLSAGSIRPLGQGVKIDTAPIGCAYSGETLVVVTPTGASAIQDGKLVWSASLQSLPGADAAPTGAVAENQDAEEPQEEIFLQLNDQPDIVQRQVINGRVRIINGGFPVGAAFRPADNSGPERISHFRLLSDRLVYATSTGRVVSCDLADGRISWQGRPVDHSVRHFEAIDDFIAVSSTDPNGFSEVHVIDPITGQNLNRMTFDPSQPGRQLMNLSLSRDGVLVTTTQIELAGRDLYEPTTGSWKRDVGNRQGEMPFMNLTRQDQLVITDGRVLALTASGNRPQAVRAFDLHTGEPRQSTDPRNGRKVDTAYPVGSIGNINTLPPPVGIAAASSQFYIVGEKTFKAFNLDANGSWAPDGLAQRGPIADTLIAGDYALLIHTPVVQQGAQQVESIQIAAYSRGKLPSGDESGLLVHRPTIKDPARILNGEWQIATGSIYYVSGDQKLKLLKANP